MTLDPIGVYGATACCGAELPPAGGPETYFAPAGRASEQELRRCRDVIRSAPLLQSVLDSMPALVAILNGQRQIVAANRAFLDTVDVVEDDALGKRPGEMVGCIHVATGPDGCGTSQHCAACGAVAAILECQRAGVQVSREIRLTVDTPLGAGALDLRITTTSMKVGGEDFTLCVLEDISAKKHLDALCRTFFHDVLNTAGSVRGYAHFLAEESLGVPHCAGEIARLTALTDQLIEEVEAHRDFLRAESAELDVCLCPVPVAKVLRDLHALYCRHAVGLERRIELGEISNGQIVTDPRLLSRVLGNLVKNALEATEPGGAIRIACEDRGQTVAFHVWNAAVMPDEVQFQVFQRSFSTKGEPGRGIGTHSIKLLTERYLGGQVDFVSRPPEGTTFTVTLPKERQID